MTPDNRLPDDPDIKQAQAQAQHDPYSPAELAKHIDPTLYKALGLIQYDRIVRKQVTVVFWDVSGFSKLCIKFYNFEDCVNYFLRIYYQKAIEIIENHHGVLDKFMGDGVLAYFGYDRTVNGDPFGAVEAALEFKKQFPTIKRRFVQYCKEQKIKKISPIDLKCGINNGPAFFNYFNTPTRNNVTVLGSTLNFASRLEGRALSNEIILSEDLGDMIYENYRLRKVDIPENDKIDAYEEEKAYYVLEGKKR